MDCAELQALCLISDVGIFDLASAGHYHDVYGNRTVVQVPRLKSGKVGVVLRFTPQQVTVCQVVTDTYSLVKVDRCSMWRSVPKSRTSDLTLSVPYSNNKKRIELNCKLSHETLFLYGDESDLNIVINQYEMLEETRKYLMRRKKK